MFTQLGISYGSASDVRQEKLGLSDSSIWQSCATKPWSTEAGLDAGADATGEFHKTAPSDDGAPSHLRLALDIRLDPGDTECRVHPMVARDVVRADAAWA
jgi:hypothetical protein